MTDEAAELEPAREEPRLEDPGPTDHSKRNYLAILKRAFKSASEDHVTSLAAALAYYAFLAIPATLLIAAGIFGLVAGPDAVDTLIDKLHGIVPAEVTDLVRGSLNRLTETQGTSTGVCSSIFAVKFGYQMGVCGLQNGSIQVVTVSRKGMIQKRPGPAMA